MERRSMLALSGTALTALLTGCSALGGGGEDTPTDESTPPGTPTDGSTPTDPPGTPTDPPGTGTDDTSSPTPDVPETLVNGSFEADWGAWTVGRDLPEDPNREGSQQVASRVGVTTEAATDGTNSCWAFIDGSQDDGTVWVQQPVDLSGYDYLAVDYVVSDSFNEIRQPAVYAGPEPSEQLTEQDMDTSRSLEGHAAPGWKTFVYEVDHDGPGIVAVGWSVVWETGAEAIFDNVRLSADEPETRTPSPPTDDRGSGETGSGAGDGEIGTDDGDGEAGNGAGDGETGSGTGDGGAGDGEAGSSTGDGEAGSGTGDGEAGTDDGEI